MPLSLSPAHGGISLSLIALLPILMVPYSHFQKVMRFLVVEDQPASARLMARLLQRIGAVDIASTMQEALSRAAQVTYDLFLVDIQLSGQGNGIDLVHHLRQQPQYALVPVVACSAFVHPDDSQTLMKEGFNAFVAKPFMIDELMGAVGTHLKKA
jgi:CheY-like chemotaxis protein